MPGILVMLVLLMFFVPGFLVTPSPVFTLVPGIEPVIVHVRLVPLLQPPPIVLILLPVPIVIVPIVSVVYSAITFPLLVPLVIVLILSYRDCKRPNRHDKSGRQKHRCYPSISTTHSFPPEQLH